MSESVLEVLVLSNEVLVHDIDLVVQDGDSLFVLLSDLCGYLLVL